MASVIYLTDTRYGQRAWQHPSARHRCYHYADALLRQGHNSVVLPLEQATGEILADYDHAVFHRPVYTKRFRRALEQCQAASLTLHADYDDLIFHGDYARYSPLYVDGKRDVSSVAKQFEKNHKAAVCFKSFFVSTAYLAEQLQNTIPTASVTLLPNSLPATFQNPRGGESVTPEQKIIGYFPGSRGHGQDLKSVLPALREVVGADSTLLIVGRMDASDYAGVEGVVHLPFAKYSDYLNILSRVDVSIAPLVDNEFNQAKSAVKLIESVAVGTPIISSENQDMSDHANDLSCIATGIDQWIHSLKNALSNERKLKCSRNVVHDLGQRYSVSNRLPLLLERL